MPPLRRHRYAHLSSRDPIRKVLSIIHAPGCANMGERKEANASIAGRNSVAFASHVRIVFQPTAAGPGAMMGALGTPANGKPRVGV
ncbi:hypothetical protein MRX96_024459 [Rhipicephalus microplus]